MITRKIGLMLAAFVMTFTLINAKACNSSDPYGMAAKASLDVAAVVHAGADATDKLQKGGTITVADERLALNGLGSVTALNKAYQTCVMAVHTSSSTTGAYLSCANGFLGTVSNPSFLQEMQIKNESSLQTVQNVVTGVEGILNTLIINLQNAPAPKPLQ